MRVRALQLALAAVLGCREPEKPAMPQSTAPVTPATPAAVPRNRLVISVDVEPAHLLPIDDCDEWCFRIALGAIFEPLANVTSDGKLVPSGLTTRVEESADRLSYSFELRPNARWQDGTALSVLDVAATYERIIDPRGGLLRLRDDLRDLRGVEQLDDRHGRIVLEHPNAFLSAVLAEIPILPRTQVSRNPRGRAPVLSRQPFARHPMGSGPYRLQSWERGRRLLLKRDPQYTGPPAAMDEIEFRIERDGARALGALRRGELDILPRVLPSHWPDQVLTPTVRVAYRELRLTPARFTLLLPNLRRSPLSDRRVRQALALLVDRARLMRETRKGLGRLVFPGDLAVAYDVPFAIDLLREVGGITRKLEVLHAARSPAVDAEIAILRSGAAAAGLSLGAVAAESLDMAARLPRGAFDLALVSYATRREADLSELVGTGGSVNFGGFSDPTVDSLLERLRREAPGEGRAALWHELGRALGEAMPIIPLYAVDEVALVRKTVQGVTVKGEWLDLATLRLTDGSNKP